MIRSLEQTLFRHRGAVLALLGALTIASAVLSARLELDTAVESHLPAGNELIRTFLDYRDRLGTDRVIVVLRAKQGDVWTVPFLRKLEQTNDTLGALPGIDRRTLTSLWTPNVTMLELTEEGLRTEDVIDREVTADALTPEEVRRARDRATRGGLIGRLVARDQSAAMVVASAANPGSGADGGSPGPVELGAELEHGVREALDDDAYEVLLLGFPTLIGDIARAARTAFTVLLPVSLALIAVVVWLGSRSAPLTAIVLGCAIVSTLWQLGGMVLAGLPFDPLSLPVAFLVFAVGVGLGVVQARVLLDVANGGGEGAARICFRRMLRPLALGLLALAAAFATLTLLPIPSVQTLGLASVLGIGCKLVSNGVLLPLLASFLRLPARRGDPVSAGVSGLFGGLAGRRFSARVLVACALLAALGVWQARGRSFGDAQPGAAELRPDSRYNRDAAFVTSQFDFRLDLLSLIVEAPPDSCIDWQVMDYVDRLTWHMQNTPGVASVMSAPLVSRFLYSMWNGGNPKWTGIPRNRYSLMQVTSSIPAALGVVSRDCSLFMVQVFTEDHRDDTIEAVVASARAFRDANPSDLVRLRLASGGVAVQAATNEVVQQAEWPMLGWSLLGAVALAALGLRSIRLPLACGVAWALATLLAQAAMGWAGMGLTPATLPLLAVGIGLGACMGLPLLDAWARHRALGTDLAEAWRLAVAERGGAVAWMALVLVVAGCVWSFSGLTAQSHAGVLLVGLVLLHAAAALTALPAFLRALGGASAAPALLWVGALALSAPGARADDAALRSDLAARSLLLDAARAGDRIVAVGQRGDVVMSDDGGATWRQARAVSTRATLTGVCFADTRTGWAVGHDAVILHTTDGGETWEEQHAAPELDSPLFAVWFDDATRGLAVGAYGVAFRTDDGGRSWQRTRLDPDADLHLYDLVPIPDGGLLVPAEDGVVYRSRDRGRSWERRSLPYASSAWGGLALADGALLVFGMRGHLFRSEDGADTWREIATGTEASLTGAAELSDGTIVVSALEGTVLESDDGGRSFRPSVRPGRHRYTAVIEGAAGRVLLLGDSGVETLDDGDPGTPPRAAVARTASDRAAGSAGGHGIVRSRNHPER